MKRLVKVLFRVLIGGLIGIVAIIAVGLYWLLYTESALHWTINKLNPQITATSVEGTITELSFTGLSIELETAEIDISSGNFSWTPADLLNRSLRIEHIEMSGVNISTNTDQAEKSTEPQDINLPFALVFERVRLNDILLALADNSLIPLDTLQLEGRLQGNVLDLKTVSIQQAENTATILGQIDLSTKSTGIINIEHNFNWLYQDQTIQMEGLISGTWGSTDFTLVGTSPVELELDGHLDGLISDSMSWSSNLNISDTSGLNLTDLPLTVDSARLNSQGSYTPTAGIEGLSVEIDGIVNGSNPQFPSWQAQTKLQLENQSLNIETLNLQSLVSDQPLTTDLTGTLQFPSFVDVSLENSVANLSGNWTSLTWPLQAQPALVTSNGKFSATGPLNNIHILANSEGEADEHSVVADIDLLIGTSSIVVNNFELSADSSEMQASGIINDQIQLTWAISSSDLSSVFTDISGQIDGSGTLSGERDNPKLLLTAQTSGLSNAQFSIGAAKIFADASLADQTEALTVAIAAENFQFDQQPVIESFNLEIGGSTQEHTLVVESQLAKGTSAKILATGHWDSSQWNAKVNDVQLESPQLGSWALDRDLLISASANKFDVSNSCLVNSSQSICAELHQSVGISNINGNISDISLENLNPLLKNYALKINGVADGDFSFTKNQSNPSATNIDVSAEGAEIIWLNSEQDEQSSESFKFESVQLSISQESQLNANAELRISDKDSIRAQINLDKPFTADTFQSSALTGNGNINLVELSIIPVAVLNNIGLTGHFSSDFSIQGTPSNPAIYANGALQNASVEISDIGLFLENINLELDASGDNSIYVLGSLNSGSGLLNLDGDIDLADINSPTANFSFRGEDLQLVDSHELKAVGKVDLSTKIAPDRLDIRGNISVDQARLDFVLPESLILASSDVILEGEAVQAAAFQQILDINLDLGDDTHIEAQGFQSKLAGEIRVLQEANGIMRGQGQLNLSDGYYQGYGQNLEIDDGQVTFDGGSIEEPNLNIQAQEIIGETIVGIQITGTANAPEITLFSTPSMTDEDILSMLVFRKPVSELSSQDGIVLLSIASSLQGDGTSQITQLSDKVQQIFGLSTFELNLTDTDPNVFVGKQISSKLNVGYGYSLLDAVQSLILEYKVSQSWSVKANAGANSGADLQYKVER